MTSGQETERVYSYNPGDHMRHPYTDTGTKVQRQTYTACHLCDNVLLRRLMEPEKKEVGPGRHGVVVDNQSINQSISLIATLRPGSRIANDMQLK